MNTETMLTIFAIVAALGLVTVVAVEALSIVQEAEARGCPLSVAVNASKGRCFNPGPSGQQQEEEQQTQTEQRGEQIQGQGQDRDR
jgi:hypothetical protein